MAGTSFTLVFSLTIGIIEKLLSTKRKKKKKHDKFLVLGKSKLGDIETLVSQALMSIELIHEEFVTILKEKDKYEKSKNVRNVYEKLEKSPENRRLNSANSKT